MEPESPPPPYLLAAPVEQLAPLVLTSPHSGRNYPADFLAASRLDAMAIRRSEDSFIDDLFAFAPSLGVPLLGAKFPRAYCDVNREAWELDQTMFEDTLPDYVNAGSPRVKAGLGTIARIVGAGEPIYRRKLRFTEARLRVEQCWQPYHGILQRLISATLKKFGVCLVLDCHSMPSAVAQSAAKPPDVVLGDVFGTSCAPRLTGYVDGRLRLAGLNVQRNDPYAGGYITRFYGQPRQNVHVLQIEFLRSLYMDEQRFTKTGQFAALSEMLQSFLASLIEAPGLLLPDDMERLPNAAE